MLFVDNLRDNGKTLKSRLFFDEIFKKVKFELKLCKPVVKEPTDKLFNNKFFGQFFSCDFIVLKLRLRKF